MTDNTTPTIPCDPQYRSLPADWGEVQMWLPLMRRLCNAGKARLPGLSVLSVRILVDEHGRPQWWSNPKQTHIEPGRKGEEFAKLIEEMAGE